MTVHVDAIGVSQTVGPPQQGTKSLPVLQVALPSL